MKEEAIITIEEVAAPQDEKEPHLCVVIPAHNEVKTIGDVVKGALKYADEVLVIDDGSTDSTALVAKAAGAKIIRLPNNCGYGAALSTGISTAALNDSDIIVWLDADGQHNPEEIPRVVAPVLRGDADLVIGSRFLLKKGNKDAPRYRTVGQRILTKATNASNDAGVTDSQSGFRCITKKAALSLNFKENGMGISSEIIMDASNLGLRIAEVPISCKYKGLETSSIQPVQHGSNVISAILRVIRDEHPLLLFGVSGLIMSVIGISAGLYSLYQFMNYKALPFLPSLIAVLFFFVGLISIFSGIILNSIATRQRNNHAN